MMRAKLKVNEVRRFETCDQLQLSAVCKSDGQYDAAGTDENNTFSKFTPQAEMTMTVNNPELIGKIQPGQFFYVDFTLADESQA